MNHLRQMSVFAYVVETGSISAAAEVLNLSKSVISQHLKALETDLGVVLLKRTTRKQTLTTAGSEFYQKCRLLNSVAEQAWNEAQSNQQIPRGVIRITAPHALMNDLIVPAVAELVVKYSEIRPEMIANDEQLDLMDNNIDLAIRVGQSASSNLMQRRIGEFRDILCISSELEPALTQGPQSATRAAVSDKSTTATPLTNQASGIRYIANHWQGDSIIHQLENRRNGKKHSLSFTPWCRANSFHTCLAMLEAGAGAGIVPEFIFAKNPALKQLLPDFQLPTVAVYALHPYKGNLPLIVRLCLEKIETRLNKKSRTGVRQGG
ncbi:LysR family transcriptional regulator [Motiliproteus sp. MSK22-1]|uniref:LysR family transcriptional regulator n=1 Tax=Motiliproteus sp. MSK22-1 TaxID=1897630 RepID=UPI0009788E04|nr:LysR family transcriptional regulator [Motiliproteus sp. MSK22-1]OMH39275.1 hypothetical protein BGP75_04065 [Motiliproteus sp. MSK22-1]